MNQSVYMRLAFALLAVFVLGAIGATIASVLTANDGLFVYTYDDAYIHLALSENIARGHYGLNLNEHSAPASSIIWPLLLAPFAQSIYTPLVLNTIATLGATYCVVRSVTESLDGVSTLLQCLFAAGVSLCVVLATNLIGLSFIGMEHTLQVCVVAAVALGLIVESRTGKAPLWLLIAIFLAPLVRYETMAVAAVALLFLLVRGHWLKSILTGVAIVAALASFSMFLVSLGLEFLPSSILAKSDVLDSKGSAMVRKILTALSLRQGMVLVVYAAFLAWYAFFGSTPVKRMLAACGLLATCLHVALGNFQMFGRYEAYILCFALLLLLYIFGDSLKRRIESGFFALAGVSGLVAVVGFAVAFPYIVSLGQSVQASNNIYSQQYQMHRFATDYWQDSVAINDLGYVAYQNDNYVLDLWGLGSHEAIAARREAAKGQDWILAEVGGEWMNTLATARGVELAMIYDQWFIPIPDSWTKVGELLLHGPVVTPAHANVSFYATRGEAVPRIIESLRAFEGSLPDTASFSYTLD